MARLLPESKPKRRRLLVIAAVVFALAMPAVPALSATTAAGASGPSFVDGAGLHVLGVTRYDARDYNVVVLSPYLGRPVNVRLLLPAGYAQHPTERYPVLYLFHGTSGYASDWIDAGGAEQTTAPYNLITVMPDCGFNGDGGFWFTNWVDQATSHGPSQFEDYLIKSLIPWVDLNLRTIATRDGRAVAGLSQGGYGSAEMAARHPDMFVSMASFSGAPEIERDPEVYAGAIGVIEAIEVGDDRVPPFSELGNPATDQINWAGHDPATLITNLRGMSIDLWTGEGIDGPYDTAPNPAASAIEAAVYESTEHFHEHLVAEGIPSYYDDYVYGTHSFPYWARDLRAYVPMMMADFAHPKHPVTVSFMSIDKSWTQWGYVVSMNRPTPQQFTSLTDGSAAGFYFSGSGTATVTTPGQYRPGSHLTIVISGPKGSKTETLSVGPTGRVTLVLPLGSGGQDRVQIRTAS
jgi:S-formylglutathione hydrolase FrmB